MARITPLWALGASACRRANAGVQTQRPDGVHGLLGIYSLVTIIRMKHITICKILLRKHPVPLADSYMRELTEVETPQLLKMMLKQ